MKLDKMWAVGIAVGAIVVFVAALGIWNGCIADSSEGCVAVIEKDGVEVSRVNLSAIKEPRFIYIDSRYPTKILVEPGSVSFYGSTCPDKICEHYGKLSKKGQMAICLPARVVIRIDGNDENADAVDGITG